MTTQEAIIIILDYIERWNKKDEDREAAEAASVLQEFVSWQLEREKKQKASAEKTNTIYSTKKRKEAAKKAWRKRLNKKVRKFLKTLSTK